jgi:hypothetical protein
MDILPAYYFHARVFTPTNDLFQQPERLFLGHDNDILAMEKEVFATLLRCI